MNWIGIYYPASSFWHRIDPRSKMAFVLAMMLLLLTCRGIGLGLLCLVTAVLYRTSKLPWQLEWEVIRKFRWLLLIPFGVNLMVPFEENWFFTLNRNFSGAITILLRLTVLLLIATWLSYVTKPMVLVEGLTRLFKPFQRFSRGLDLPLMMGLVVRFIPELFYESENIMVAQRIRGIKPGFTFQNSSGWLKSTIIPVFLGSIRKATALAVAMEARGYRPGIRRSSIEQLKLGFPDYVIIGLSFLSIVYVTIIAIF
ncbi:MAG: energy-coupling factor transporter transmembrane component T family protein [Bacteroidota bacterium]